MDRGYRVAVVGATGQVGTLMLELLRERSFPASEIVAFASERSAGRTLEGVGATGEDLVVQPLTEESIQGFDIALFSAGGATSGEWAPRFAAAGAVVIDNSSRWRMKDDVPLVVSEVNPDALADHHGIIANPNCSTMQMVVALAPLHREAGIERLVVSTYQAVSGTGKRAVDELLDQSHALLHERPIDAPAAYAHQIAFNALPHAGSFADGEDHTDEERKLMNETRKILGDPSIAISATCVRVPVLNGHSEAVNVQTRERPRRPRGRAVSAGDRRERQGRGVRGPHPPRSRPRACAGHVDRLGQPSQGRGHQRDPARRARARTRPARRSPRALCRLSSSHPPSPTARRRLTRATSGPSRSL